MTDDTIVFGVRFCEPAEIAELGAAERLYPDPRCQRHLGDVAVVRSRIDLVVEALVDLVKAFGIAGVAQHPQFLVDRFQLLPIRRRHPFGGKPRAQRL